LSLLLLLVMELVVSWQSLARANKWVASVQVLLVLLLVVVVVPSGALCMLQRVKTLAWQVVAVSAVVAVLRISRGRAATSKSFA
jgi:hypothetical protein